MDKKELDILIDKSILGTLTQNEKAKLDAYIMEQPTTKLEIKMRTDILKGLEYNADQELKDVLNKIHGEEILHTKHRRLYNQIRVAAIFIGLLVGAFALFKMFSNPVNSTNLSGPALYASYYQPYVPSVETRSSDNTQDEMYQSFIEAYRAQDYQKALETITPHLEDAETNTLLMAGISAMELDKNQESITYFDSIIATNDFYFTDHAKWYKALVLLKTDKINEAKQLLNDLASNPKADHYDESVSLLKEI